MTKTLKVTVTEQLVARATQRDSRHCMIAEAISTARPDLTHVLVDLATIRWSNPRTGKRYVALTPEIAATELVRFDRGEPIAPFSFNLTAIQVTQRTVRTETKDEAAAAGRRTPRRDRPSHTGQLTLDTKGQPTIDGGQPLPTGHLANGPKRPQPQAEPDATASNTTRSGTRYRAYGRRILAG